MSFGVVFLILAVGFLGLITLPKLSSKRQSTEAEPKPVRGDELAIWPFAPTPIMTDTEVIFFKKLKKKANTVCLLVILPLLIDAYICIPYINHRKLKPVTQSLHQNVLAQYD